MKQIIKIASPFERVINTLLEIKNDFNAYNTQLQILSEKEVIDQYQLSSNDALKAGLIDANISNNFHTMQGYNNIYQNSPAQKLLVMVSPLFHPKYGLFIHKNNALGVKTLEDVKKHKHLRLLFAPFNELHIAPCDLSRSLFLLKKLKLINIPEEKIKTKGFELNLMDIENIYDLQFMKTSHLLDISQKFQNQQKYDLAINCPGMMRHDNFIRIGSIGEGPDYNIEPQEDVFLSYAVILATTKENENNPKIAILQKVLNSPNYKKHQFAYGGTTQDYIMVEDPIALKKKIENKFLHKTQSSSCHL
ncbi:metal ABC transporter substrate-binding protein [Candidatus Phytoplasma meliae]|uniref:Metal ABC transporter substrate-binding protein n=1 Tax=Candidatus Phytoplasma meliae TaxID=1848402 RepID=A0ABS5CYU4_9MOLU|nr:metal ABC transporter substrate-binding protein [Candidatus Phytoplasma meliae]MBP5836144.1 metal ABC transporter substrate-binding protein [Candidatus Phytoplasma meliae]MBP5836247.1 metal ABC transporter substrate-binding protein [Candidatus Phytoplasma meliae]